MIPDLKLAIRLQTLDDRAAELTKQVSVLPKHIAEIEKKLETHQRRLNANRTALTANLKERKKAESDIQMQEQKISKLKAQMLDAKTNEQYRAFQNEIEFCENEIKRCEEQILELMGQSEPLDKAVKEAEAALAVEAKQVEAEKSQAQQGTAAVRAQLDELQTQRTEIAKQLSPALLREYERIRKGRSGVAVAEVLNGRCVKCNMSVRLQMQQELKKGDQIMKCESCGRILFYNPPESFEDLTASATLA